MIFPWKSNGLLNGLDQPRNEDIAPHQPTRDPASSQQHARPGRKDGPLGLGVEPFLPVRTTESYGESGRGQDNLVRKTGLALVILGTEAPLSRFA